VDRDRVSRHYDRTPESDRFESPAGLLEYERTRAILARWMSTEPLRVLDVGGATGAYAFWLAEKGHEVTLLDASSRHIEIAEERNRTATNRLRAIRLGRAEELAFAGGSFDFVLLMGPLYHLTTHQARAAALAEASRVLRSGGFLVAAYISRFASFLDGYRRGFIEDPLFADLVGHDLETGIHDPPENSRYFTEAYFHRPSEIRHELIEAGLRHEETLAVEGPLWLVPALERYIKDEASRELLLSLLDRVGSEPSMLGASAHLLALSRKPAVQIGPCGDEEISRVWRERWGGDTVVSRGRLHHPCDVTGIGCYEHGTLTGLATYRIDGIACELVSVDSMLADSGVGTRLLEEVIGAARAAGCSRLWLITTNDNVDALDFYQRRGWDIVGFHREALSDSRRLKPQIPETGAHGIAVRHEIELERRLSGSSEQIGDPE
jgi:ubiquinone/menaquinone biosynthesis C-methylase UbiE